MNFMDQNELETLDLHPKIIEAVKKIKLTRFEQILALSLKELERETGLSETFVKCLQLAAAKASVTSKFVTCFEIKQGQCLLNLQKRRLSFGCPILNKTLNGGLLTGTITEITGESSAGKTQFCLQLAIQAQLPQEYGGLTSKVAYICTEEKFPFKRLNSITTTLRKKYLQFKNISFSDNIFINHVKTFPQMLKCFESAVPNLIKKNVRLVIIDSVAGLFRSNYETNEYAKRAQDLQKFGGAIWKLVNIHGIIIVCVNQVSSTMNSKQLGYCKLNENLIPTLGLVWANLLTTRLALHKTNNTIVSISHSYPLTIRTLKVIFSSYLPRTSCCYIVTENGISGLNQSAKMVTL